MAEGAKIIWVLFGDIKTLNGKPATKYQQRIVTAYRRHEKQLNSKGYTLGFGSEPYCSKKAFLYLLAERATFGMIWHSHGNRLGQLTGGLGETISPGDIVDVSENLHFAAIWGCDIQHSAYEWRRVLNLNKKYPQDSGKRFASHPGAIFDQDYDLGSFAMEPPPVQFIDTVNRFYPYYPFREWIELLP